jgi:hypothetical protein
VRTEVVALRDRYEQIWPQAIDSGVTAGRFRVRAPGLARLALIRTH